MHTPRLCHWFSRIRTTALLTAASLLLALPLQALNPPALQAPANNASTIVRHPSFTWSSVSGASHYQIQLSISSSFSPLLLSTTVEIPRFVPLAPLPLQSVYWRVRTYDSTGVPGAWSPAFLYAPVAPASTYTIPSGATLATIRNTINTAKANPPALVSFAAGATYNLTPASGEVAVLNLADTNDLILEGNGATIVIKNPRAGFLHSTRSSRVTVRNFFIDYDPLPHSVAMVEAKSGGVLSLRRQPGYPPLNSPDLIANTTSGSILDNNNRGWLKPERDVTYYFNSAQTQAVPGDPDLFTIPLNNAAHAADFTIGDRVVFWARENANSLFWTYNYGEDFTFYRITSYACPGLHYSAIDASDVKVLECKALLKNSSRWVSGNADGVHTRANRLGPWVEASTFVGIGDDGVALYNKGNYISQKLSDTQVRVLGQFFYLKAGDQFKIFNPRDAVLIGTTYTATSVVANGGAWDVTFTPSLNGAAITVNSSNPTVSDQIFNLTRRNAHFMVKDNLFSGSLCYGVIARCPDGVIKNNHFEGMALSSIILRNEANSFANGLYSERLLIENNTIEKSGFSRLGRNDDITQRGDIAVKINTVTNIVPQSAATRLHRDIVIRGNRIKDWIRRAISIENTVNCTVADNVIWSNEHSPAGPNFAAIYVRNTTNTTITGNDLFDETRFLDAEIQIEANNSGATTSGNLLPPSVAAITKDNVDAGVVFSGSWSTTSAFGCYGADARFATAGGSKTATYTPTIPAAGHYDVYLRWSAADNRATNTPVTINRSGGASTVAVNQRIDGGVWKFLGSYPFAAGTSGNVVISSNGADGYVVADAVKFVRSPVIVDNADGSGVVITGSWSTTTAAGCYGPNALFTTAGTGKTVRFTPQLSASGAYHVYLRWNAATNRATNTPVDITHADGTTTFALNQTIDGGVWNHLGTFSFAAGSTGNVLVRANGADGYIVADAVMFIPAP